MTPTPSPRPTAAASGGMASTPRSSTPAATSSCPTASPPSTQQTTGTSITTASGPKIRRPTTPSSSRPGSSAARSSWTSTSPTSSTSTTTTSRSVRPASTPPHTSTTRRSPATAHSSASSTERTSNPITPAPSLSISSAARAKEILAEPWQTDTCIGDWHYRRSIFENHTYKTPRTVIHTLIDVVSKNGNLLLSIPVRGNGEIDEDEHAFLKGIATWLPAHGEAIYGTRPFTIFGEGTQDLADNKGFSEDKQRPYTSADIRFTTKGDTLYAFALGWPADEGKPGTLTIRALARTSPHLKRPIQRIDLLGAEAPLRFTQTAEALVVTLPERKPNDYAYALRIRT